MMKYKPEEKKYHLETYSISERERMMGLPVGYVKDPGEWIFLSLTHFLFPTFFHRY